MTNVRPPIPESVKRKVRKRCGFGCVICGLPVYHYEHIEEWSYVQEHTESNITLLCAKHHDDKTRKRLPPQKVRKHNKNPYNISRPHTAADDLHFEESYGAVIMAGGNRHAIMGSGSAIKIDGHSLIDFELIDGRLLLNADVSDPWGQPLLQVRRNELTHSTNQWDYTYVGQTLSIWHAPRKYSLVIKFVPEEATVIIEKGLVSHNGVEVWLTPQSLCILNNRILISGSTVHGFDAAIEIGENPDRISFSSTAFSFKNINREPFDRDAAIRWAREKMK